MFLFPWMFVVLPLIRFYGEIIHHLETYGGASLSPVGGFTSRVFKQVWDRWMLRLGVG